MKLELGLDVLRSYKRLPYKPWHAIAEFVDNSTQSYFNNRENLDRAYAAEGSGLEVRIVYEKDGAGLLRIADNAMGMNHDELTRAMHIGLPPESIDGRSRYGLGMKMAACWFGDSWTIVTKKLGEPTEYTVSVDVERVASGEAELNESSIDGLPLEDHYTRIEITNLNHRPQGRTLAKIKQFIGGMYRLDIEDGDLVLTWQGVPLDPSVDWKFLKNVFGEDFRKSYEFEVNGKGVRGWVGVLDSGGRPKAGFAIVHNGRMVQTWPDAWHPEAIFGQEGGSNDLVNQRLVGEIYLDEFDVSHTKDDIHWVDNEEDDVQSKLQEVCAEYRDVARQTKKSREFQGAALQAALRAIESEIESAEFSDLLDEEPPSVEIIEVDESILLSEVDVSITDFSATFPFRGGRVTVLGKLDTTRSANDPYVLSQATKEDQVTVAINMQHPHVASIDENGLLNYIKMCTYDALAEWRARIQLSTVEPSTIRKLKDEYLRLAFDIEMHRT